MLHKRIDFNKDVATDVRFFNPFGPNMLYMSLDDHYVTDLLKIVNKLSSRQDIKERLTELRVREERIEDIYEIWEGREAG